MAIAVDPTQTEESRYRRALFPIVAGIALLAFLAAPWPLGVKAHALLHGLCAQRPSHTFTFGGRELPFDARMTGIYAGFFFSAILLVARGRHRAGKLPHATRDSSWNINGPHSGTFTRRASLWKCPASGSWLACARIRTWWCSPRR